MPRDIPVGNGSLLITHDQNYCLRDIYYPSIGKENHTDGHGIKFGVWVDDKLNWIDEGWEISLGYVRGLVTQVEGVNESLGVKLQCHDLVDYRENISAIHYKISVAKPSHLFEKTRADPFIRF
jgi:glucoamylase